MCKSNFDMMLATLPRKGAQCKSYLLFYKNASVFYVFFKNHLLDRNAVRMTKPLGFS